MFSIYPLTVFTATSAPHSSSSSSRPCGQALSSSLPTSTHSHGRTAAVSSDPTVPQANSGNAGRTDTRHHDRSGEQRSGAAVRAPRPPLLQPISEPSSVSAANPLFLNAAAAAANAPTPLSPAPPGRNSGANRAAPPALHSVERAAPTAPGNPRSSRSASAAMQREGSTAFSDAPVSASRRPSQLAPGTPSHSGGEGDKRRARNMLRATLQVFGLVGPMLTTGGTMTSTLPSQRYRDSVIANRRVYDEPGGRDPHPAGERDPGRRRSSAFVRGDSETTDADDRSSRTGAARAMNETTSASNGMERHHHHHRHGHSGRARQAEERVKAGGLSTDAQHRILRRLQYVCPSAVDDMALDTPYTAYTPYTPGQTSITHADDVAEVPRTRARAATPQSVDTSSIGTGCGGPRTQEELDWVNSLLPASPGDLPYPEASTHCQVCLRHFRSGEDVAELPCGHLFHFYCVVRWLRSHAQCPFCRQEVLERKGSRGDEAAGPRHRTNSAPPPDV